jgi:hypothetical protein
MSFMMVVEGNRLISERVKMGVMYLLCVSRLALDGNCCFDVVTEEFKEGMIAEGEPFMVLVFSQGILDMFYTLKAMIPSELFCESSHLT